MSEGTAGQVAATISTEMVKLFADTTGRGPTKARASIGRDHVLVVLRETLTKGERNLVENGFGDEVLGVRERFQQVMRPRAEAMIEELLGQRVVGFMSDNQLEPDLAAEIFILEPGSHNGDGHVAEADSARD